MPEPINSLERVDRPQTDLETEIATRDEEILRLRDQLIARDAELGAVKGRLKIIEDHSERLSRLTTRIPIPGARWVVDALLRLMAARGG